MRICRSEEVRIPALMILSQLCTEYEAKDLLNLSARSLLVGFLGKSVRNDLPPMENTKWAAYRRMYVIRTLGNMITSDELVVASLLDFRILEFLGEALDVPTENNKTNELHATLTCLWTLTQNAEALQLMALNASLFKGPAY